MKDGMKSWAFPLLLNVLWPGLGLVYLKRRPKWGLFWMAFSLLGVLAFLGGGFVATIGALILMLSIAAAFFTFGLSLVFGLPIAFILLLFGAGTVVGPLMYLGALIATEIQTVSGSGSRPRT